MPLNAMQKPRVSVVIPCFNLGRYLPEAVASVRSQTLSDFEMVVVDDGSTDAATADAIRNVSGPDLRVVRSENRGLSAARNLGIAHARADYISCLDADDAFEPQWLELGVARLDADPTLAFVSHWLEAFGDEQGEWTPGRSDLAALLDQNVFNGAALFRRQLVDAVGGFDESMREGCEDWEFWIRVMAAGHRGAIVPAVLYRYRRRHDSMSRAMNSDDTWFGLFGELVVQHPDVYREHLLDLLLRREWSIARLCSGIDAVQREIPTTLEPAMLEYQREVNAARVRLTHEPPLETVAALREHAEGLEAANRALHEERTRAHAQIEALHASWSWRLTGPLRRMYEWLTPGGADSR